MQRDVPRPLPEVFRRAKHAESLVLATTDGGTVPPLTALRNKLQGRRARERRSALSSPPGVFDTAAESVLRRETASNQQVPEISVGKTRLRGRQNESCTARVCGPVEKERRTGCQGVVPTVVSLTASGKPPG